LHAETQPDSQLRLGTARALGLSNYRGEAFLERVGEALDRHVRDRREVVELDPEFAAQLRAIGGLELPATAAV